MEQRTRPKRRFFPDQVYDRAQELLNEVPPLSFVAIADQLAAEWSTFAVKDDRPPPTATSIADWKRSGWIVLNSEDAPWSIEDSSPEDAALILPVLVVDDEVRADMAKRGFPMRPAWRPTVKHARWIARVRRIAPDLQDVWLAVSIAQYLSVGGEARKRAETVLAYAPWRSQEPLFRAVQRGTVGNGLLFELGLDDDYFKWIADQRRGDVANG